MGRNRCPGKNFRTFRCKLQHLNQFIHIDETKVLDQELLSDLVASYLKQAEMAETTRDRRSEVFRSLLDYWNGPAMDLTPDIINAWVGRPSKKTKRALSPTTQHLRIGTVSSLLNWAVRNKKISANPIHKMDRPRPKRRKRFLVTEEEVERLLSLLTEPFRSLYRFCILTGARASEGIHAEWRHLIRSPDPRLVFPENETKTRKADRVIWINREAMQIVDAQYSSSLSRRPHERIFKDEEGKPWTKDTVMARMRRPQKQLGWPVRLTDARHRFAVDKLRRGLDPLFISKLLGHVNTKMLYDVYGHLAEDNLSQYAEF